MAGAVRSKYLQLLTIYACVYASFLLVIIFSNLLGLRSIVVPPFLGILALVVLVYHAFIFRIATRRFGRQAAHSIGVALLAFPMALVSAISGGYESYNNIAFILLIFFSAMLGYAIPLALVWIQILGFVLAVGGYLPALGSTTIGALMLLFYSLAAVTGWVAFHSYYTREDPEAERLRKTLREQQLQSEGVITAINDGVAIVDKNGITLHANQHFLDTMALTDEEFFGKHYAQIMTTKVRIVSSSIDAPRIGPNIARVLETGQPVIIENETIEYTDNRPAVDMSVSITALKNDDGDVSAVMIITHDISHIMQLQRMKDALIATASHELRTPITVIAGYADLLLGDSAGALNDKQRHYMQRTRDTTTHLTDMINDMLDISRLESGQRENNPESIDLVPLLQLAVEDHLGRFAGKQIVLKLDAEPAHVFADRSRLQQVIDGLLTNAYKFTPDEGKVTLSSKLVNNHMEIAVTDTGIGVPEDRKDIVFEKFTKLDDTGSIPGAGLGLAIAKNIVESWHGKIAVENQPGGGARFYFTVPLAQTHHKDQTKKGNT